jgi:hypothetical protein
VTKQNVNYLLQFVAAHFPTFSKGGDTVSIILFDLTSVTAQIWLFGSKYNNMVTKSNAKHGKIMPTG